MAGKQQRQKIKGNPASVRMTNERRKDRRHACWLRSQERKKANQEAQAARERANKQREGPTPWEQAQAARKARRAADPNVQARAQMHRARQLS